MTVNDDFEFAGLLVARLCHDLVSPVGAMANGVELLKDEEDPAMRQQCMQLLADSATQAANRLRFFRLAFGAPGNREEQIDNQQLQSLVAGLFPAEKIKLVWQVAPVLLPRRVARILLNLALLGGDALLRGGTLTVAVDDEAGHFDCAIQAAGPRTLLGEDFRNALLGISTDGPPQSRIASALLVRRMLDSTERLSLSSPDQAIVTITAHLVA